MEGREEEREARKARETRQGWRRGVGVHELQKASPLAI